MGSNQCECQALAAGNAPDLGFPCRVCLRPWLLLMALRRTGLFPCRQASRVRETLPLAAGAPLELGSLCRQASSVLAPLLAWALLSSKAFAAGRQALSSQASCADGLCSNSGVAA